MPNSGHGGPSGTRVMTTFVFFISRQIPNIEYFEVYGGLQALGGISFFSREISRRMQSESCLAPPGARVMSIFVKTYIFA